MTTTLTLELANALDVKPDNIRAISSARDGGYNVVLDDYRKIRNVQPKPVEPENQPQETVSEVVDADVVPGTEIYIPEELQAAYAKPHRATVKTLKELCELLEIKTPKRITKAKIVQQVNEWKLEHAP
jgi:hypothetical protein